MVKLKGKDYVFDFEVEWLKAKVVILKWESQLGWFDFEVWSSTFEDFAF